MRIKFLEVFFIVAYSGGNGQTFENYGVVCSNVEEVIEMIMSKDLWNAVVCSKYKQTEKGMLRTIYSKF